MKYTEDNSESLVKNVKKFVTEFESSNLLAPASSDCSINQTLNSGKLTRNDDKYGKGKKVTALMESIEKSMQHEFQPQRCLPSLGRPLAEVKIALCQSMELSSELNVSSQDKSVFFKPKRECKTFNYLKRYNSSEILDNLHEENRNVNLTENNRPIPAPRLFAVQKQEKKYRSISDLKSNSFSTSFNNVETGNIEVFDKEPPCETLNTDKKVQSNIETQELGDSSELFAPGSNDRSKSPSTKSCDSLGNDDEIRQTDVCESNTFEFDSVSSNIPAINLDCCSFQDETNEVSTNTCDVSSEANPATQPVSISDGKPCLKVSPFRLVPSELSLNVSYQCRLSGTNWNQAIESVSSDKEKFFLIKAKKLIELDPSLEEWLGPLRLLESRSNFDLILDVMVLEEDVVSLPILEKCSAHKLVSSKEELVSDGMELQSELLTLSKHVEADLSSLFASKEMLVKKLTSNGLNKTYVTRYEGLIEETDKAINLLFLLCRMKHSSDQQTHNVKPSNYNSKLDEAKNIKRGIDSKYQKLFKNLKLSLSHGLFEECSHILIQNIFFKLKKECIFLKLMALEKIILGVQSFEN